MELDPKFLEWIGQMMLLSAKNMEQADRFMRWFQEGFPEGRQWEKWLEPYLQLLPKDSDKGTKELRALFQEFFKNLGIVSREEYLELQERYQELKQEIDELNKKLSEERKRGFDLIGDWAELIKKMSAANAKLFEEWQKLILIPVKKGEKKND